MRTKIDRGEPLVVRHQVTVDGFSLEGVVSLEIREPDPAKALAIARGVLKGDPS